MNDWPPSNYPILIALMLLAVTALTLAIGDDKLADNLAIYAYYLLVIGVAIRFFELALPSLQINPPAKKISLVPSSITNHGSIFIRNMGIMLKNLYTTLRSHLRRAIFEMKVRISGFKRQSLKMQRLHIVNPGKNIVLISEISMNIVIFLSVFFIFSLIYGITIDWWFVKGYLNNLIFAILSFLTLYIVLRVRF
ncbi:MAG TPA: hypothetical protein VF354_01820 [Candidatus Methanoperedens sp.]